MPIREESVSPASDQSCSAQNRVAWATAFSSHSFPTQSGPADRTRVSHFGHRDSGIEPLDLGIATVALSDIADALLGPVRGGRTPRHPEIDAKVVQGAVRGRQGRRRCR